MMSPEPDLPRYRFALLASGANFSCEVLQALREQHFLPTLLVMPEYPPAKDLPEAGAGIIAASPRRRFVELGQEIEIGYAPAARQTEGVRLVQQFAIDYLLVACWPYLIGEALIDSPRKAALNLHPSLLPGYRGPNPIEQQLAQRGSRFGVTLHLLNGQFDRGDIVAQAELSDIDGKADRAYLEHRSAVLGVELFIEALKSHDRGWKPIPQTA
jgi:methionyl-tRNA formyltransferase